MTLSLTPDRVRELTQSARRPDTAPVPRLGRRPTVSRSAFHAVLTANGISECTFLTVCNANGWSAETITRIEELDEVALNFLSAKWKKVVLPSLKSANTPAE